MVVCPSCGANLKFSPEKQKMCCEFCESEFDPEEFNEQGGAEEQQVMEETLAPEEAMEVTIFTCPQCGGELMSVDENTAAAFCSFCGASTILESRIAKEKRPKYIIPFAITKEQCKEAYMKMVSGSIYAPKELKDEKYIDSFRGIYMPYWTYDISQKGEVTIKGETSSRKGDYIVTKHYDLKGNIDAEYDGISYDASSSFSDDISERIAPFDTNKQIDFGNSYMSGYYADIADVGKTVYENDARLLAYDMSLDNIKKEFKEYTVKDTKSGIKARVDKVDYTMFPVWFMSYRNKDRVAYAIVNGQTGKVVADMPIDIKKYLISSGGLAIVIFILLNIFSIITPRALVVLGGILMGMVYFINMSQRKKINKKDLGIDDKGLKSVKSTLKENSNAEVMEGSEKISLILAVVVVGVAALMWLFKPVSDIPYYVCTYFEAIIFAMNFKVTLEKYNKLVTRKLPQFDRKGGDDRA